MYIVAVISLIASQSADAMRARSRQLFGFAKEIPGLKNNCQIFKNLPQRRLGSTRPEKIPTFYHTAGQKLLRLFNYALGGFALFVMGEEHGIAVEREWQIERERKQREQGYQSFQLPTEGSPESCMRSHRCNMQTDRNNISSMERRMERDSLRRNLKPD